MECRGQISLKVVSPSQQTLPNEVEGVNMKMSSTPTELISEEYTHESGSPFERIVPTGRR